MRFREQNTLLSNGEVEFVKKWLNDTHELGLWIPIKNWKMGPFDIETKEPQLFLTMNQIRLTRSWEIASPTTIFPWAINEELSISIKGYERPIHG